MSSDSDNDRPQSSEDSSEDTTTLLGENERLKKELSEKEELIRTQTAKVGIKACMKQYHQVYRSHSDAHNVTHANLKMVYCKLLH
jgi:hypothetical protein